MTAIMIFVYIINIVIVYERGDRSFACIANGDDFGQYIKDKMYTHFI